VRAEGDEFVIYANGVGIAEFGDDEFERAGWRVRACSRGGAYTIKSRILHSGIWKKSELKFSPSI
jgi:hypothetical protein